MLVIILIDLRRDGLSGNWRHGSDLNRCGIRRQRLEMNVRATIMTHNKEVAQSSDARELGGLY